MDTEQQSNNRREPTPAQLAARFKPGQSGNPGGRKKGTVSLVTLARQKLREICEDPKAEGKSYAELFAAAWIANAIKGKDAPFKQLLDRLEGPVPTTFDQDGVLRILVKYVDGLGAPPHDERESETSDSGEVPDCGYDTSRD